MQGHRMERRLSVSYFILFKKIFLFSLICRRVSYRKGSELATNKKPACKLDFLAKDKNVINLQFGITGKFNTCLKEEKVINDKLNAIDNNTQVFVV
jgi:hypothetical protein